MRPIEWMMAGDTGTSSKTIMSVIEGTDPPAHGPDAPHDPADFGRCHRLLQHFPLYRLRLAEVAAAYPAWTGFVREWDDLTALYEAESPSGRCPLLYARMKELRDEGMIADGWTRTACGWRKDRAATQPEGREA